MKYLLFVLSITGFCACSQAPNNTGKASKNEGYPTFKFSNEPANMDVRDPNNWCNAKLGEAALISADPKNYHRRLFALSDIPCRVIIDFGHQSAAFMLYKRGKQVEIYTSDNLPTCLSNKANFQLSPEGMNFQYNNKMDINFNVYLQELSNGLQIALDLPPDGGLGMAVLLCEACK